jgi:dsDNA-specific endonuclease/ATPase MutS2
MLRLNGIGIWKEDANISEPVEVPIEDRIDLHSFQPREVADLVEEYLFQAVCRRFDQVRIVHGRGIGVQREIVHSILRRNKHVVSFFDTADHGATIVCLRKEEFD